MTDWGVHLLDIVQWAMNVEGPSEIVAQGGKLYLQDNRETPDTLQVTYQYPGFVCVYENRECNGARLDGHGYGICFHGSLGTMFLDRAGFQIIPEKTPKGVNQCEPVAEKSSNNHNLAHSRNFLDCLKSRQLPICDIEIGHRSTSVAQLGNIAYTTKSHILWGTKGGGHERQQTSQQAPLGQVSETLEACGLRPASRKSVKANPWQQRLES